MNEDAGDEIVRQSWESVHVCPPRGSSKSNLVAPDFRAFLDLISEIRPQWKSAKADVGSPRSLEGRHSLPIGRGNRSHRHR